LVNRLLIAAAGALAAAAKEDRCGDRVVVSHVTLRDG
jgi:hypothetical protein